MTLIQKIGRYQFDILSTVATITNDDGGAVVKLPHGVELTLTAQEKAELDAACAHHASVVKLYAQARSAGLRG
jgi:hypothetical protein